MAVTNLTWSGDVWLDQLQRTMAERLDKAVRFAHNRIKEKLSLTGVGFASTSRIRRKRRARIYGFARSRPGEPPRKQTGVLRMNVAYETDAKSLTARVGVGGAPVARGKAYAIYLELGTRKMAARPYLRTTMYEQSANLRAILEGRGTEAVQGVQAGANLGEALANVATVPLGGVGAP